jgi:hypothetical protein
MEHTHVVPLVHFRTFGETLNFSSADLTDILVKSVLPGKFRSMRATDCFFLVNECSKKAATYDVGCWFGGCGPERVLLLPQLVAIDIVRAMYTAAHVFTCYGIRTVPKKLVPTWELTPWDFEGSQRAGQVSRSSSGLTIPESWDSDYIGLEKEYD